MILYCVKINDFITIYIYIKELIYKNVEQCPIPSQSFMVVG